jgi:hypothetical protein
MGVRMRHPDLEQEINATSGQVPHFQVSGWQVIEGQDEQGEQWPAELLPFEGQEKVRLTHPDLEGEITVAESAVPYHRERGWQVVEGEEPAAGPEGADGLDGKTVPELRDLAKDEDIKPVPTTKPELLDALRGHQQAPAEAGQPTEEA